MIVIIVSIFAGHQERVWYGRQNNLENETRIISYLINDIEGA